MPQGVEPIRTSKPPADKIRKYGAEEFRATAEDDLERAKFWLKNTIRVLDELSCPPAECLKCAISLLKETAYQWWNTLISVVPRENVTWEFSQTEFKNKYINQRFLDQEKKEFLGLKQENLTREFIWLSKYAREWVPTEADMCKHFEEGLNEDIKLLIRILELMEFVVLADRAHNAEELSKKKKQAERVAQISGKRFMGKSQASTLKKSKKIP
ncbi:Hexaprenyldihydroxybenzoate methyltransferase, mitochondrial-like protein [Gossypium australe]|uniref:Hexaprenyldihydroxybenzoate methyltransferase, mitochondrial-like protein n=1 Tax=Gossypium australe TaxID=47621 RepID=A0A5B6W8Z7_9ROSI|nr:Hexaprenyldihydroxybenzoate methyltransferase, mitochondrial-like protein [Gossypium australe]